MEGFATVGVVLHLADVQPGAGGKENDGGVVQERKAAADLGQVVAARFGAALHQIPFVHTDHAALGRVVNVAGQSQLRRAESAANGRLGLAQQGLKAGTREGDRRGEPVRTGSYTTASADMDPHGEMSP